MRAPQRLISSALDAFQSTSVTRSQFFRSSRVTKVRSNSPECEGKLEFPYRVKAIGGNTSCDRAHFAF